MPSYYMTLKICDGEGTVGPYANVDEARDKLLQTAARRERDYGETWRSTTPLKWASTNGHTLEVIEK